jgi:hypothetical protein
MHLTCPVLFLISTVVSDKAGNKSTHSLLTSEFCPECCLSQKGAWARSPTAGLQNSLISSNQSCTLPLPHPQIKN